MNNEKQLLDPIGTICKLIFLNFMETKTKIRIKDHTLFIHRPSDYKHELLLTLDRYWNNNGKEDISKLFTVVIVRFIEWYLMPGHNADFKNIACEDLNKPNELENSMYFKKEEQRVATYAESERFYMQLREIAKYLCDAFVQLQETYASGNVVFTLQYYIDLLNAGIDGTYDKTKLPAVIMREEEQQKNFLDYTKIRDLWDVDKINRIYEQYVICFRTRDDASLPEDKKQKLINGYLKSIDNILNITDTDFRDLVQHNTIG
jgi:hypothetical protein